MTISVDYTIRNMVNDLVARNGEIDTSLAIPTITSKSVVVDAYTGVLTGLVGLVEAYRQLVVQDAATVCVIVDEIERADARLAADLRRTVDPAKVWGSGGAAATAGTPTYGSGQ